MSSFKLQSSFKVDYAPASIKKWRSERTGLQCTVIDQKSPVVKGYFAVATEIEDDSGCPHTLEHLIFMGSKKYPYKGLLDTLGNLAFANTNAWTGTDQTVYNLNTAGWEGFKMLLPVYLDHLIFPTLTDEACYTEVYHVDGEAKEKGVVFSEMIANVNNAWSVNALEIQRNMYAPTSGYSSETGGLIEKLRVLTNDKIRKYHADNYRPDNLNLIITGTVDEAELLQLLEQFDTELPALPSVPNKRPFVDSPIDLPLKEEILKVVEFPDKDESTGQINISWIGPEATNHLHNIALDILGSYLTESAIAWLPKHMVEVEDPYAVDIYYYTDDFIRTNVNLALLGVPTEKLQDARDKTFELLNSASKDFDLARVRQVLETAKKRFVFETEKSPDNLAELVIDHFLYGKVDGSDLASWIKDLNEYDELAAWTEEQWIALMDQYLIQNKSCSVLGRPSASLYAEKKRENAELAEKRKAELDLAALKKKLQDAMDLNDRPIPESILTEFGQPDPSKLQFIESTTIGAGLNDNSVNSDTELGRLVKADTPADFPLFLHFEDFESQFVSIQLFASSFQVDVELLPYLSVFEDIFSMPVVLEDNTEIPYEKVVADIDRDTISTRFGVGLGHYNSLEELACVEIEAPRENYAKAVEWLHNALYRSRFDKSRVRIHVEKQINRLPDAKRSGSQMIKSVTNKHVVTDRSLKKSTDPLQTESFYLELLDKIDEGSYEEIESKLEKIRDQLFKPENMRLFISGGVSKLSHPVSTWSKFTKAKRPELMLPLSRTKDTLTETGLKLSQEAFLISTPASEAAYLNVATRIPTDYLHEDVPKIALCSAYLQAIEGPFWRGIRGTGLAYGANITRELEVGQLAFDIYRGADAEKCLEVGKAIVDEYATGAKQFEPKMIQGAISSIVNQIAEMQQSNFLASMDKFVDDVLIGRGPNYKTKSLQKLRDVTTADLIYAMKKYFVPIFEVEKSCIFAAIHPSKCDEFVKYLESSGFKVSTEYLSVEESESDFDDDEDGDSSDCSSDDDC